MRQDKSRDKGRGQAKGTKLTVKKEATKDLALKRDVRAGGGTPDRDPRDPLNRLSSNHNETLVLDQRFTAQRVQ